MNELRIGIFLRIGVFVCAFITIIGLLLIILSHHSSLITHAQGIFVTQLGLVLLIYMQIFRVFLTLWLFIERRAWIFVGCSIFIFIALCYSVLWQA